MLPATALAHIERPSYWPSPRPDDSINPEAGGEVPGARSLESALNPKARGEARVVCQDNSMSLLRNSVADARKHGYDIRPTDHRKLSNKRADRLLRINRRLA